MTPKSATPEDSDVPPSWDDIREEASALTREVAEQGLIWTRRAFKLASRAAWSAAQRAEKAKKRASSTMGKVRGQ